MDEGGLSTACLVYHEADAVLLLLAPLAQVLSRIAHAAAAEAVLRRAGQRVLRPNEAHTDGDSRF